MSKVTVRAVGEGRSFLALEDAPSSADVPMILPGQGDAYPVELVYNATIAVGEPCGATPTPRVPVNQINPPGGTGAATPEPGVTAPVTGTPIPVADSRVALDAIPAGNAADAPGDIDKCASAEAGDVFDVDVIVENMTDLLAFNVPVTFDPEVLEVTGRDVKLFLQSTAGSQVLDSSGQTPNSTGVYQTGAVDTADPLSPDSGSGVVARVEFTAVGEGVSELTMEKDDVNQDGTFDTGVLLRNVDALIGDEDGDTLYDGPQDGAEIRVGEACDDEDARVADVADAASPSPSGTDGPDAGGDDDDGAPVLPIVAGIALLGVLAGGAAYAFRKRRTAAG